jgi:DNA-binding transcriptional MerR regulator
MNGAQIHYMFDLRETEMSSETLTIRQMCDLYDVTPRTLRFYEAKELLFPIREGQRRLFTRRDRARLKLILRGKRFGFSLEEIRQLLDLYYVGDQQATQLSRTLDVASQRLGDMERQRSELDVAIDDLKSQMSLVEDMLSTLAPARDAAE